MEGCTNITHEVAIPLLKGFPPECVCPLLTIRGPPHSRSTCSFPNADLETAITLILVGGYILFLFKKWNIIYKLTHSFVVLGNQCQDQEYPYAIQKLLLQEACGVGQNIPNLISKFPWLLQITLGRRSGSKVPMKISF